MLITHRRTALAESLLCHQLHRHAVHELTGLTKERVRQLDQDIHGPGHSPGRPPSLTHFFVSRPVRRECTIFLSNFYFLVQHTPLHIPLGYIVLKAFEAYHADLRWPPSAHRKGLTINQVYALIRACVAQDIDLRHCIHKERHIFALPPPHLEVPLQADRCPLCHERAGQQVESPRLKHRLAELQRLTRLPGRFARPVSALPKPVET